MLRVSKKSYGFIVERQNEVGKWRKALDIVYKHRSNATDKMRRMRYAEKKEERSDIGARVMASRQFCNLT